MNQMGLLNSIIRSLFGKDNTDIWHQFAVEKNGTYAPVSDHRVLLQRKGAVITFDNYYDYPNVGNASGVNLTRGIAEFVAVDQYTLTITRQGVAENIGKAFGAQDIRIGVQPFDKTFMIKSNDETKTQQLLNDDLIQQLLLEIHPIRLAITNGEGLWNERPKEGHFMLYVVSEDPVKTIAQLDEFYLLMTELLDRLTLSKSIK